MTKKPAFSVKQSLKFFITFLSVSIFLFRFDPTVLPETGMFYMFPALLQHWVCPFKSKVTRISVSGNLRILNKDKLPNDYF